MFELSVVRQSVSSRQQPGVLSSCEAPVFISPVFGMFASNMLHFAVFSGIKILVVLRKIARRAIPMDRRS